MCCRCCSVRHCGTTCVVIAYYSITCYGITFYGCYDITCYGHGIWLNSFHGSLTDVVPYIVQSTANGGGKLEPEWQSFIVFWSYVIILQVMIPISLYVSIEIVKLGQVFFITQDRNLWYTVPANPANQNKTPVVKRIQCRALNIPEELGQIQYVMCDKTGTLTENNMIFRRCTVAGVDYGSDGNFCKNNETSKDVRANPKLKDLLFRMWSDRHDTESSLVVDFFTNMALCNTVVVNPHAHSPREQKRPQMINEVPSSILTYEKDQIGVKQSLDETRLITTSDQNGRLKSHKELHDMVSIQASTKPMTSVDDNNAIFPDSKLYCRRRVKLPRIILPYVEASSNDTATTAPALVPIRRGSLSLPSLNTADLENGFSHEKRKLSAPHRKPNDGDFSDSSMKSEPDLRKLNNRSIDDDYENDDPNRQVGRGRIIQQKFKAANLQLSKLLHDLPPMMKSKLKLTFAQLNFKKWQTTDGKEQSLNYKNPFYEAESPDELALVYAAAAYGRKDISREEYELWSKNHENAEMSIDDRDDLLNKSALEIEKNLHLLGAAGIEDRLQEGVPECIEVLRQGGLKIWILTGDKIETAINIAYACKLFLYGMTLIQLCAANEAAIVELVKQKLGGTTLAIGDGANDVSMIQCANVGIGISGQEGMQAVMASDFAMARFKFLQPLLFVHGHWCYSRVAKLVLYFFYKNALFVITLFFFQIWNGFSAQVMIDLLYLMLYNLVFTSLSPLLLGIFDKDAPYHILNDNPQLYVQGSNGQLYRSNSFWLNMLDALWQGLIVFFIPFLIFYQTEVQIWSFGFFITSCLVIVNQLHLALQVESWTVPLALSIFLSIGAFYSFSLLYNGICRTCCSSDAPYYVAQNAMQRPDYWLCIILVTVVALFPRVISTLSQILDLVSLQQNDYFALMKKIRFCQMLLEFSQPS
uniref:P-type ATPase C-terminal domain-containing protein n=2 Tax=Romanomermis culicivorax TaxID=13658 RepID=A0A915HGC0_ROMCU